jgi:hypothetical protein
VDRRLPVTRQRQCGDAERTAGPNIGEGRLVRDHNIDKKRNLLCGAVALQHFVPLRRREQDSVARGLIEFQQFSGVSTRSRRNGGFLGLLRF